MEVAFAMNGLFVYIFDAVALGMGLRVTLETSEYRIRSITKQRLRILVSAIFVSCSKTFSQIPWTCRLQNMKGADEIARRRFYIAFCKSPIR